MEVVGGLGLVLDDGGRHRAGHVGRAGDCAVRAVAIAALRPYQLVYDELRQRSRRRPRHGVEKSALIRYLHALGWSQLRIAVGPLTAGHVPAGRLVVELAGKDPREGHLAAVVDHVVHDTGDPLRGRARVLSVWTGPVNDQPLGDAALTLW